MACFIEAILTGDLSQMDFISFAFRLRHIVAFLFFLLFLIHPNTFIVFLTHICLHALISLSIMQYLVCVCTLNSCQNIDRDRGAV